ncbi:MAG: hypothetical protein R3C16_03940 [Hyphomonadaceae bacterium]
MEMMLATGSCAGIENYSRYLTGRKPGEPPPTMFEYILDNALVFTDEPRHHPADRRHVSRRLQPQEDAQRLRLPPALVHGQPPAQIREEWDAMRPSSIHVSATPEPWEMERTGGVSLSR